MQSFVVFDVCNLCIGCTNWKVPHLKQYNVQTLTSVEGTGYWQKKLTHFSFCTFFSEAARLKSGQQKKKKPHIFLQKKIFVCFSCALAVEVF